MPSWSNASPVLLEDGSRIFVTSEPDEVVAVNPVDGKILWKRSLKDVTLDRVITHKANGWTSPTPRSDGRRVYTVFGSGVVAAHSIDGKRLWAREVQQPVHKWGFSVSPVIDEGNLIVHLVDLIALDPETGKEVWRRAAKVTFGSSVVTQVGGTDVVITASGDVFQAKDGSPVARYRKA
jgi:outer membrane protein assembly factor BamB